MWKTGHSLIKEKMKEMGAPLAGEMSGHMFFGEGFYGLDDALYAAARLLRIVARLGKPVDADCSPTCRSSSPRPRCASTSPEEIKFAVVERRRRSTSAPATR